MEINVFSTEGRIRRSIFWVRWLVAAAINITVQIVMYSTKDPKIFPMVIIISLLTTIFTVIQGIKRMHDVDKSGWYFLIPFYNLILAVTDGTPMQNQYGEDPKGRSDNWICPACGTANESNSELCLQCGRAHQSVPAVVNTSKTDTLLISAITFMFVNALVTFLIQRLIPDWYSGPAKFVYISFNMLWAIVPVVLSLAIKNEKLKTLAVIMAGLYALNVIVNNVQWMFN